MTSLLRELLHAKTRDGPGFRFNGPGFRFTLALNPEDMRQGFNSLSDVALAELDLDVSLGVDWVLFIGKSGKSLKLIGQSNNSQHLIGSKVIVGTLNYLTKYASSADNACCNLTIDEVLALMEGQKIIPAALSGADRTESR